jgi:hypothetical protein
MCRIDRLCWLGSTATSRIIDQQEWQTGARRAPRRGAIVVLFAIVRRRTTCHVGSRHLLGHALIALLILIVVPSVLLGGSLVTAISVAPDLGYTQAVVGAIALGWGLLRSALALNLLRRPIARTELTAPAHA